MGKGGGGGVIGTVVSVVTAPITAPIAIAEAVAPDLASKAESTVAKIPVVGTVSQGAVASSHLGEDVLSGGNTKGDLVSLAKAGAVIGGVAAGGVVGGVIGNSVANSANPLGALEGAASAYAGNTLLDNTGVDLNQFLPKPGTGGTVVGSLPAAPSSGGKQVVPDYGVPDTGGGATVALIGVAVVVLILIVKKGK